MIFYSNWKKNSSFIIYLKFLNIETEFKYEIDLPFYVIYAKKKFVGFCNCRIDPYDGFVYSEITNALGGRTLDVISNTYIGENYDFFGNLGNGANFYKGEYVALFR